VRLLLSHREALTVTGLAEIVLDVSDCLSERPFQEFNFVALVL